ncbi:MAG: hypothetical protein NT157_00145 [Candidatus Micrarchaeota archaeon]|nr:hypothetical protein [Candidatus Micrarchaeota archaeon]
MLDPKNMRLSVYPEFISDADPRVVESAAYFITLLILRERLDPRKLKYKTDFTGALLDASRKFENDPELKAQLELLELKLGMMKLPDKPAKELPRGVILHRERLASQKESSRKGQWARRNMRPMKR